MELIKISNQDGKTAVSAKDLHAFLESKKDFSAWIKHRIDKYGLVEGQDFIIAHPNGGAGNNGFFGGHNAKDYVLTLDAAKELAMVEGNAKGKQARQYFIEKEKEANQNSKPLSPAEILLHQAQMLVNMEKQNKEIIANQIRLEEKINQVEAKSITRPEYYTIAGYGSKIGIYVTTPTAATLGKKASAMCRKENIEVGETHDPRFGKVNTYPADILKEIFNK